ncbi:hypothetical protein [Paracidovorax avenae]|uniref:hypothetical protein n=1 Tax=Paracidovorax avenae TaxID=80867 RepID=UPI001AD8049A|nr:hypothetical protein [Paracidovorax avenae]
MSVPRLSLPALDNHVDNPGTALYGHRKCLIFLKNPRTAQILCNAPPDGARLSRTAWDNNVDNTGAALYGVRKCLIHKGLIPVAQKLGSGKPSLDTPMAP